MIELKIRPPLSLEYSHKDILEDGLKIFLCPFCGNPVKYYYFSGRYCENLECAKTLPDVKGISTEEEIRVAWHFGS